MTFGKLSYPQRMVTPLPGVVDYAQEWGKDPLPRGKEYEHFLAQVIQRQFSIKAWLCFCEQFCYMHGN